ncbi:LysR family transcriptional regulator [Pontivivens ytuae]|uniref:LysR family transcriptional regulator n=1 Tax=Pontivivens ytuae TaxID=2789856 RepID=A0A7S9QCR7_9RHOB|nr:LysR family transcriptional regulator [Pontivivens ytuae]QPH53647.1 LysR family transcriptional regulator [Pontivivens ytuae]
MDWDHLRLFLATARAGSLRAAADEQKVSHATIRRALDGLEQTLGTTLFERSPGGVALTGSGEVLLRHAQSMEGETRQIARRLSGLDAAPRGRIRVSLPPSFALGFLAPILASFTEAYPEITVEIIATNRISNLTRHEADISIRAAHTVEDDVVGRRLLRYVVGAFASPAYLEQVGVPELGDGHKAHWIGWGRDGEWVSQSPYPRAGIRHVLPEIFMQLEAAAQGIGMAWVPCFLGDQEPRLVRVPGLQPVPDRSLWLLLHGDLRGSARVRAFVDHAAKAVLADRERYTT